MRKLAILLASGAALLFAEKSSAQAIDKAKIWDDNRGAVVQIRAFGSGADGSPKSIDAGTGFFVSPDGYILTAMHIVGRDEDWGKVGPDQTPDRHIEVTSLDHAGTPHLVSRNAYVKLVPGVDLALLRVDGHCFQYAKLAAQRPTGFPTLVAIVWGTDTVPHPTSTDLTETDVSRSGDMLTIDRIAAVGGYSGSPLFNAVGEVVGVLSNRFGDQGALAIPSTEAISSVPVNNAASTTSYPNSCYSMCSHPDHGIDHWSHEEAWTADSGWRDGGSDPTSFCAREKLNQEGAHPGAVVTFEALPEDHRVEWNPFKHDQYRYYCNGMNRWDPVYVTARSPACGLQPQ